MPRVEDYFTYHAPQGDQPARYAALRDAALAFAREIERLVPQGPDRTVAIRKLRESVMTANAAIALEGCGP